MAAPTFVAAGTVDSGNGAVAPGLPAGVAADDILIMTVQSSNQTIATPTNATSGTWAQIQTQAGVGTAATANATRLGFFWMRYASATGTITVADTGDHTLARIAAYRGCKTTGNPWNVVSSAMGVTNNPTPIQTTVADCLFLLGEVDSVDSTSAGSAPSTATNLGTVNARWRQNIQTGTGGGIMLCDATVTATGTNTNLLITTGGNCVHCLVALEPPVVLSDPVLPNFANQPSNFHLF